MVIWLWDKEGKWIPTEFENAQLELGFDGADPVVDETVSTPVAKLLRWSDHYDKTRYVLFPYSPDQFRVNGNFLFGHKLLGNKDEIRFRGEQGEIHLYFSSEGLPRIRPFRTKDDTPVFCIRCKQRMEAGQPAVQCPGCSLWYHQSEHKACWSYDGRCAGCHRTTSMDYVWKPEPMTRPRTISHLNGWSAEGPSS